MPVFLPNKIHEEIRSHFSRHLEAFPRDFICIYGSSIYRARVQSDVDMFLVSSETQNISIESIAQFVREMHIRHGRKIDIEVPFENKVLYSHDEIKAAVQLGGFNTTNGISVPPIRKEPDFLSGQAVKARLILNALTTPHVVIGRDLSQYYVFKQQMETAITLLGTELQGAANFTISDLLSALLEDDKGNTGEMFLGYKPEYHAVTEYLHDVLGRTISRLVQSHVIQEKNGSFSFRLLKFDPLIYLKSITDS